MVLFRVCGFTGPFEVLVEITVVSFMISVVVVLEGFDPVVAGILVLLAARSGTSS